MYLPWWMDRFMSVIRGEQFLILLICIRNNLGETFHNTDLPGLEPSVWVSCSGTEPRHLCVDSSGSSGELPQHTGPSAPPENTDSDPRQVRGLGSCFWCSPKNEKNLTDLAGMILDKRHLEKGLRYSWETTKDENSVCLQWDCSEIGWWWW